MRMRKILTIIGLVCAITPLWAQPKTVKFTANKKEPIQLQQIESWFSFIPMQSFRSVSNELQSVHAFYMMRIETPNVLYKLFIDDLKTNGKLAEYEAALPDTNIWSNNNQPYVDYYFRHPAYKYYPVVGVSKQKIQMFCTWLNEKVSTLTLKTWKDKKIYFRLPNEMEWMVAAAGGDTNAVYAWKGPFMRKLSPYLKKNEQIFAGDYQANFQRVEDSQIMRNEKGELVVFRNNATKVAESLKGYADITAPVLNYWPNDYGLFNMSGNVREMVLEDGFTKGGSWIDPGGELKIRFRNTIQMQGYPCEGFRLVAVVE